MATDALDPNLIRSAKPAPKTTETAPTPVASRRKRILKTLAYVVFFFWSLITFTLLKVPDSVVANFLLNTLNQNTPYQWQAERITVGFFPTPHLRLEKLGLEPKFPGAGIPLFVDEIRIYPNPLALIPLGGGPAFGASFRAEAYKSTIHGSFKSGANLALRLQSEGLDLAKITPLTERIDIKGQITLLEVDIDMPNQRLGSASGEIRLKGKNAQFDPSSLQLPMALPLLNLGDVDVQGTLTKGLLKIEKFKIGGAGKDLDLQIPNGTVTLADVTYNTRYDLHLLLKPSATINQAVPGFAGMMGMWSTVKPDGFFAMRVQGSLAAPGFPSKD